MHIDSKPAAAPSAAVRAIIDEASKIADGVYPICSAVDSRFPVHTRLGTVEVFPGTMTPAAWASSGSAVSRMTQRVAAEMGIVSASDPLSFQGVFYGCCATNISSYIHVMRRLPGAPWLPWSRSALAVVQPHADPITGWEPPPNLVSWLVDCLWRLRGWGRSRRLEAELQREMAPLETQLEQGEAEIATRDYSALGVEELIEELKKPTLNTQLVRIHVGVTLLVGSHYMRLVQAIARHTDMPPIHTANGLLVAIGDVESAKPALALEIMAPLVREAPRLANLLRAGQFAEFAATLAAPGDAAEQRVADARNDFLKLYGYRGIGESTIDATTWGEDPGQADRLLALYVASDGMRDASAGARRREALEAKVLARIANATVRARVQGYIRSVQTFAAMRERSKSLTVRQSLRTRRILKALTARLVEAGAFEKEEDREMLSFKELTGALTMDRNTLRELITRRRHVYQLMKKLDIVEQTFSGLPTPRLADAATSGQAEVGAVLAGLCISPGRVEGVARVIRDPREAAVIRAGEILVAPYTDAAWSPLFVLASGVVIDSATLISHGATVARELGLPAVANVAGTTAIRDGDRILVDADRAEVTILERPEPAPVEAATQQGSTAFTHTRRAFAVLRSLRLKGRAATAALVAGSGLAPESIAEILDGAQSAGLCVREDDTWQMTPAGFSWVEENLVHDRPDPVAAEALHERFLPLNGQFKQLAFDWQMRDPQTLNDHKDASYDAAILARLDTLHEQMRELVVSVGQLNSRLVPFGERFEKALQHVKSGETQFLMSPRVDSYHTVWFEFHEELIGMTGRTRAEEAAAGRGA
ncbi:MAG: PEP-utilizing enzyme [Porticoccaceae bacterium]